MREYNEVEVLRSEDAASEGRSDHITFSDELRKHKDCSDEILSRFFDNWFQFATPSHFTEVFGEQC